MQTDNELISDVIEALRQTLLNKATDNANGERSDSITVKIGDKITVKIK